MSAKLDKWKSKFPQFQDTFVYRADFDLTGILMSGEGQLISLVKAYIHKRLSTLAKNSGYLKYIVIPAYGKRDVVLMTGNV